jgi:hypothetical protein
MKATKITIIVSLLLGVAFLGYICLNSITTPIKFVQEKELREKKVQERLIDLRTAANEYKLVHGRYTDNIDSLIIFLKTTPKKEVYKEKSLTEWQLEKEMTEEKITKTINEARAKALQKSPGLAEQSADSIYSYIWKNDKKIMEDSLVGFKRDTIKTNMIQALYKGKYDDKTIEEIVYIPYNKDKKKFTIKVDNDYWTSIHTPLIEISAHYNDYLSDLDKQELVNIIDKVEKLNHEKKEKDPEAELNFAGLKIGSVHGPNNNAANWE